MLIAHIKPHSAFALPLQTADFKFTTSDDGDESGQVVFTPTTARTATFAQIGEELHVYCPTLSRVIWRGQIERIDEEEDGSIVWNAIGFGALQREARISVVRGINNVQRWKPVGQGFIPSASNYDSRLDLWDVEQLTTTVPQLRMKTKRTFTITTLTLVYVAFVFNHPERYVKLSSSESITINSVSVTGLATGLRVTPITDIQPPDYSFTLGGTTVVSNPQTVTTTSNIFGWLIGVNASGTETSVGNTSVRFHTTVNSAFAVNDALLTTALNQRGGCCTVVFPQPPTARLEKSDANLRDIVEQLNPSSPIRWNRKRFYRDSTPIVIDFYADSPVVWRFQSRKTAQDISKAPDRIFAEYSGYWAERLTSTVVSQALSSRRTPALANRHASAGTYNSKTEAEAYRDAALTEAETGIAPMTISLDNNFYELATRNGVSVPNWGADVGDYAEIGNYFRRGKIMARTIMRENTTYDVTFPSDSFVTAIR